MDVPYNQRRPSELPEVAEPNFPESHAYLSDVHRKEPGEQPPLYLAYDQSQKEAVMDGHQQWASPTSYGYGSPYSATPMTASTYPATHDLEAPHSKDGQAQQQPPEQPEPTLCGFKRKRAIWVLVLAFVVVAAAIGGGVGGGIAASRSQGNASSVESATSTSLSSTSTSTATSSAAQASPTFLNNQSMPFAFQAFEKPEYGGQFTEWLRNAGTFDIGFNSTSYVWQPNGTSCCATMCQKNIRWTGWWCQDRKQPNSSAPFDMVIIGCQGQSEERSKNLCPWGDTLSSTASKTTASATARSTGSQTTVSGVNSQTGAARAVREVLT